MDEGLSSEETSDVYTPRPRPKGARFYCSPKTPLFDKIIELYFSCSL